MSFSTSSQQQQQQQHQKDRVILQKILDEQEYWLRLASFVHYFLEDLYHELLHKSSKLPTDPAELYKVLNKDRHRIESLLRRKKINQNQFDLIYPEDKKTLKWKFDISTFTFIVRYFTSIKPRGGWKLVNKLERGDKSKGALVIEFEHFITENIEGSEPIVKPSFNDMWNDAVYIVRSFKMPINEAIDLRKCSFANGTVPEKYEHCILKAQVQYLADNLTNVKHELQILLEEDDFLENTTDIQIRLDTCQQINLHIQDLAEQVQSRNISGKELYPKFYDINHNLEAVETEMTFLKQMIRFEKNVATNRDTERNREEDGDEEKDKDGMNEDQNHHHHQQNQEYVVLDENQDMQDGATTKTQEEIERGKNCKNECNKYIQILI